MRLIDYLPGPYVSSPETVLIQGSIQPEVDALWEDRDGLLLQLDPRTASGWGLALWEAAFGISPAASSTEEYRRTRVVAKIRGTGTVTAALIRSVAESFSNGQVEVAEFPRQSRIEVHFTGTVGIPPNIGDLAAALDDIIPTHLGWEFVIYFRTHRDLRRLTHRQMAAYTHRYLREGHIDGNDREIRIAKARAG